MADPKGSHLYVNVGASQARKRLKGFGHGVRKIQSVGRNQSVVIHTATGRHFEELQAKFDDVGSSSHEQELSEPIENLRNLGPTSCEWLKETGLYTIADLERLGPALAYRLVKQRRPKTSLNLLWAIAAGLSNRDWRELSPEEKVRLRGDVEED